MTSLEQKIPALLAHIEANQSLIKHNSILFDIYEGDLLKYILDDLKDQLSLQSFFQAQYRIAPINVLSRIINKISRIYDRPPVRKIEDDPSEADMELLDWYEDTLRINRNFKSKVRFYNLYKNSALHLYLKKYPDEVIGIPKVRVLPSNSFLPYSDDLIDPTKPNVMIVFMGERTINIGVKRTKTVKIYYAFSDDEFLIFDSDETVLRAEMEQYDNIDGVNRIGKIPIVYSNQSQNLLIPKPDSDTLCLTKLLPILVSDLNYAVMFQAFSIIWGINIKNKSLKLSPNAFWELEQEDPEKAPQIGQLKPQVDIDQVLNLIQSEFSLWMNSKGIRPGSVGNLTESNFASGISKMIDEADITEQRQDQIDEFTDVEDEFWDLVFNHAHPYWVRNGLVENKQLLSEGAKIQTIFAEQVPLYRRGELVKDLDTEVKAGFMTREDAIRRLNPYMTDAEINEYVIKVDAPIAITTPPDESEEEETE
jgi:hypothetical protein